MTADKGLAGAFNSNIVRSAETFAREQPNIAYYSVGNKARNAVRRFGEGDRPAWTLAASKLETAREVSQRVTGDFVRGDISEIVLISSKMISMMLQRPQVRRLVPIDRPKEDEAQDKAAQGAVEFAPSPEFVLSRLLPKYLEFTIYSAMLETDAGFFAAQLVAMNNATENASKLIDELTIQMNNARQAAITKELLEIVAGAEALGVE
jgi:F-type H+-transporting ATPase subunit gamma